MKEIWQATTIFSFGMMDLERKAAIHASEVQRLDQGEIDWSTITNSPVKTP